MLNWEKAREYKKEDLLESLSTWKKWNKILNEIIKNILLKIKLPDLKIIINKKSSNINFIINN